MTASPSDPSAPTLRVGLLQCGHVHADLVGDHGDYPELFGALLGPHGVVVEPYDVQLAPPPSLLDCDAWVISGSAASAYDRLPWIPPVEDFLREAVSVTAPLVAVCFGHQLLAQALGGRVERATSWGAGAHRYRLVGPIPGSEMSADRAVRLVASHQDQVTVLPDGAELVLSTDHCPNAGFTLGPAALAIQPHPEYSAGLSGDLCRVRRDRMGDDVTDAALASLDEPIDQELLGRAMVSFLRHAATATS